MGDTDMSENQTDREAITVSLEEPRAFGAILGLTKLPARFTLILSCCTIVVLATLAAPAGSAAASNWTLRQLPPMTPYEVEKQSGPTMSGISCPSESLCVAVGSAGVDTSAGPADTLAFSQAPTGGLAQWHVVTPPSPSGVTERFDLSAISCASKSLCVAVSDGARMDGQKGFIYVSTDPTGGAAAWSPTVINEGRGLFDVSCPSASFCAAVGGKGGKVFTSTDPVSGSWQMSQLAGSPELRGVSCGTPSLCVAIGKVGVTDTQAGEGRIFVSTDPTGGASTWAEAGTPGGPVGLGGVSCASTLLCAAGNLTGNVLTSTDPSGGAGSSWSEVNAGTSMRITGVSCPTASRCVAVDDNGDVLTSTDPSGGGSWHFENLVPFRPLTEGESPRNGLFAASCASTSLCALVGSDGRIFTSTDPFSAPAKPPARHRGHKARLRPRTVLLPVEWRYPQTPHRHIRVRARFYSHTRVRGFECKRDRGPYRRCHSPMRYWVSHGRHALRVRAIGPTGLRGPAALILFRIEHVRVMHVPGNYGPAAHTAG